MKKLFYLLLFPLSSFAQISDANLNLEADTIRLETLPGRNTAKRVGRMFKNIIANKPNTAALTVNNSNWSGAQLSKTNGGTGLSSPALVAGTNILITGSWPNQTINATGGGGGITNTALNSELMKSDGANSISSGVFVVGTAPRTLTIGHPALSGNQKITNESSTTDPTLQITTQGIGEIGVNSTEASTSFLVKAKAGHALAFNVTDESSNSLFSVNNATGVAYFNNSAGTSGQILSSNGGGSPQTWVSISTAWTAVSSFSGSWTGSNVRYRQDISGQVYLSGIITYNGGLFQVTPNSGFPNSVNTSTPNLICLAVSSTVLGYIQITTSGRMSCFPVSAGFTVGDQFSLNGLTYTTN